MKKLERNRDGIWWIDGGREEKVRAKGVKGFGWDDYEDILRSGGKPSKLKQKIQITFIDRIVKFYAITSGLLGISLLLSGEYLWGGVVFSSTLVVYLIGRWAKWEY